MKEQRLYDVPGSKEKTERRRFLRFSLLMLASLYLSGCLSKEKKSSLSSEAKRFLFITDVHIGKKDIASGWQANADAAKTLRFVLKHLKTNSFDHAYGLGDNLVDGKLSSNS